MPSQNTKVWLPPGLRSGDRRRVQRHAGPVQKSVFNFAIEPSEHVSPALASAAIISPTLANLTLDGLETLLKQRFRVKRVKGGVFNHKIHLMLSNTAGSIWKFHFSIDPYFVAACGGRHLCANPVPNLCLE